MINLIMTDANNAIRTGNYGQRVVKADGDLNTSAMPLGPSAIWKVSSSTEISSTPGTVSVTEVVAWIEAYMKYIASAYDIPYDLFSSQITAIGQLMTRWDLMRHKLRYESDRLAQAVEVYNKMRTIWNARTAGPRLDESLSMRLMPGVIPQPEDSLHTAQADELQVRLGVLSPVDVIARRRGCSVEEARSIWMRNLEDGNLVQRAAPPEKTPFNPEVI
jgi:hypothetical protein